jgi:hypothetical protein
MAPPPRSLFAAPPDVVPSLVRLMNVNVEGRMSIPAPRLVRGLASAAGVVLLAALATGCLDTPRTPSGQGQPQAIAVSVAPPTVAVTSGGRQVFAATVIGTADTSVTWLIEEPGCGTVTAAGLYTAPAAVATCDAVATCHVVATSHADPSRTATAAVTVACPPVVAVSVTPGSTSAFGCTSVGFSARVTGSPNTSVAWSVAEPGGGTVSAAGLYTAPSTDGTYHVVATSDANPSASASADIAVTTKVLSVTVAPADLAVLPGGNAQFTATVTTTCGSTTALAPIQAPAAGPRY